MSFDPPDARQHYVRAVIDADRTSAEPARRPGPAPGLELREGDLRTMPLPGAGCRPGLQPAGERVQAAVVGLFGVLPPPRRLTTLRTVANPLPWRKLRWFDQRYEFGHWGGHIESARTGRHGARSRRRPIRRRLASPRGARGMTPTST